MSKQPVASFSHRSEAQRTTKGAWLLSHGGLLERLFEYPAIMSRIVRGWYKRSEPVSIGQQAVSRKPASNQAMIGAMARAQRGQANLTAILAVIGLIVASVWAWKRLTPDTQDYVVEQAVPAAVAVAVAGVLVWNVVGRIQERRARARLRQRLIERFERETLPNKRRDLAFELIEMNRYTLKGLERIAPALVEVLVTTLTTALGDKQHRIRGMAASYLGVLQDKQVLPILLKALEDDHAYVRACAALGLGRLKAFEAKDKLTVVMQDDWDQTVRSRAREALERMA